MHTKMKNGIFQILIISSPFVLAAFHDALPAQVKRQISPYKFSLCYRKVSSLLLLLLLGFFFSSFSFGLF